MKNTIDIVENDNFVQIILNVVVDMDNCTTIENRITNIIKKKKRYIVLDLSNTQFIFSAGMGLLSRLNQFVADRESDFFVVNTSKKVHDTLSNIGLTRIIKVFRNENELSDYLKLEHGNYNK